MSHNFDYFIFLHLSNVDLIIEVSHPIITEIYGAEFLQHANYMVKFLKK